MNRLFVSGMILMVGGCLPGCAYHGGNAKGYQDLNILGRAHHAVDLTVVSATPATPDRGDSIYRTMWLLVPLWLYVGVTQEAGEATHYPAGYLADQIRKAGLVQAVGVERSESGKGGPRQYVAELRVAESSIRETRTTYGLSIVGSLLQTFLGLPSGSRKAALSLDLRVSDSDGRVLLGKTYSGERSATTGVFAPLWVYGPIWTYGEHVNLMPRIGEQITRDIVRDLGNAFSTEAASLKRPDR